MQRQEYSAGAVKFSFWFAEFRKVISLLRSGKSFEEIKKLSAEENIFSASTVARGAQILSTVSLRVKSLSEGFYYFFESSDLTSQKLIVLIAIMNTESLFFDFVYEVFREKLITGDTLLADSEVRVFFLNKQRESEKVAGWTDETISRLQKSYKLYMSEAGLIDHGIGDRKIIKPLLHDSLIKLLRDSDMELILNALTGVR
jgi:hypothetical protein